MNERTNEMTYNIQQVAHITGLSKQLIRKWEERYGIVHPKRLDNGYRIYTQEEVNALLYVKSLVEQGQSVKQAAMQLQKTGGLKPTVLSGRTEYMHPEINEHVRSLLNEGALCNEAKMSRILQQAYHIYGLQPFLRSVVIPFLREVGQRWNDGRWGEYQEALASLVVRDFLVQLRRNFYVDENAPLLLGTCLPHEKRENPLHIILLECMLHGWKTVMLGPSPSLVAIQSAVERLHPKKVVLSAVTTVPFEQNEQLLQELDEFAECHPQIEFYIGGPGAMQHTQGQPLQFIQVANDISDILKNSEENTGVFYKT
ncbi:MerR family transcriptional regulator [Anoxybacteroides tepidamans]|uniref:MerR family transcriptional regulator n=1 Tax=Anoxybacteroides tepidamans TaxID=265948 RepID=UPI000687935F|nr:MerR family transcriptional regulator [Anoxybacillus tepidamans]